MGEKAMIEVVWMPKARSMQAQIQPLLQSCYEAFERNNRKEVVSECMQGKYIIISCLTSKGQVSQLVLCREDIPLLPRDMQEKLYRDLQAEGYRQLSILKKGEG
jgi:hypothetical protein